MFVEGAVMPAVGTHLHDTLHNVFFVDANQISRLSRSQPNIAFLCRSTARRRSSSVFIAFPLAPPVICEALKRPGVDNGLFIDVPPLLSCTYASFDGHKVSVTRLVYPAVEFCYSHDVPTVVCSPRITLEF